MDTVHCFFLVTNPTKLLVLLLEFDPFGPIPFGKSQRAMRLNHFIFIQVSGGLNQKLAGRNLYRPHNAEAWASCITKHL